MNLCFSLCRRVDVASFAMHIQILQMFVNLATGTSRPCCLLSARWVRHKKKKQSKVANMSEVTISTAMSLFNSSMWTAV